MDSFKQECKLCGDIVSDGNFKVIEEDAKSNFDFLLLKLTLDDDTRRNVLCAMCSPKLLAAINFKSTCLYTDNSIIPYIDFENMEPVNLKEIYAKEKGSKQGSKTLNDREICRLCLQPVDNNYKSIQEVPVDRIQIYIPEINFTVSTDPIICLKCHDALCIHSTFIRNCLDIEEKRNKNATNVGDMLLSNPCIKTEDVEIKCEIEENEERDMSLHSQSGFIGTEESKILYDHEDLKEKSAESTSVVQMFKCDQCTYTTKYKSTLRRHQSRHKNPADVPMFKCDECDYKCIDKGGLNRHLLKHKDISEVPVFKCDRCTFTTKHKNSLRYHLLRYKNPSEVRMFQCDQCNHKTIRKSEMEKHQLIHKVPSEVPSFHCDQCDFKTIHKYYLKQHHLRHKNPSEVPMLQCDLCDYKTMRKGDLNKHQVMHKVPSEVRRFHCDVCNFETIYKSYMKRHQLLHKDPSEVRMFECDECDYKSIHKFCLEQHQLIHKEPSEVQMFKCDQCKFTTKRKGTLRQHQRRHKNVPE